MQKTLNTVQRKMLDKIYSEVLDEKIRNYNNQRAEKKQALVQAVTKRANTALKAKLKKVTDGIRLLAQLEAAVSEEGFSIVFNQGKNDTYGRTITSHQTDIATLSLRNRQTTHPEVKVFEEETHAGLATLKDFKNEIRADIYGLQVSYDDIRTELDKKIKALNLA